MTASSSPRVLSSSDFAFIEWTHVPVGVKHTREPVAKVRTPEQRAKIAQIVSTDEFDFFCENPLSADTGSYKGPVTVIWYDAFDVLHFTKVMPDGRVNRETSIS